MHCTSPKFWPIWAAELCAEGTSDDASFPMTIRRKQSFEFQTDHFYLTQQKCIQKLFGVSVGRHQLDFKKRTCACLDAVRICPHPLHCGEYGKPKAVHPNPNRVKAAARPRRGCVHAHDRVYTCERQMCINVPQENIEHISIIAQMIASSYVEYVCKK